MDASGSVGGAMTFSKWKGRNYVRQLVTPLNPQSNSQAEVRTKLAACGKLVKKIVTTVGTTLADQIRAVTPANQSLISYFVSTMCGMNFADFDAAKTAYAGAAGKADFDTQAAALGLSTVELPYGAYGAVTPGEALFIAYTAANRLGLAIASTPPATVTGAAVTAFKDAFTV